MQSRVTEISPDARIAAIATRQHGVASLGQLLASGLSRSQIKWRVRRRRLHPVRRGVYAVGHSLLGSEGRWLAAVLAFGDGAALSHVSAAALWGIRPSASALIDVTVPSRSGRAQRPGIRIHRGPLPPEDVMVRDVIPVTTLARTLVDLAGVIPFGALKKAIKKSERLRLFDLTAVRLALARNTGRPGAGALARALTKYEEPPFTHSDLEELMYELCERNGLPTPVVNGVVAAYEVDFLWPSRRLIIETDGREGHLTRHAFEEDRAREAHLLLLGYRVARFTYRQLRYQRGYVLSVLRRLLQPEPSISSTR